MSSYIVTLVAFACIGFLVVRVNDIRHRLDRIERIFEIDRKENEG